METIINELAQVCECLRIDEFIHLQFAFRMPLFKPATQKKYYLESYEIIGPKLQRIMKLLDNSDAVWLSELKLYEELKTSKPPVASQIIIAPTIDDEDLLCEYLKNIPLSNWQPICENICKNGLVKALEYYLGRVDLSIKDNYLLFIAIWFNHPQIVQVLMRDPRVDPSVNNNAAISLAANSGKFEIAELLIKDVRVDGSKALLGAAERNYYHIVEILKAP
ncbi:hypothetical protein HDV06_002517 [Boothiomyces sp. JEL0866]|nr:hypothetical protein HDV06_002517 [Boothiomyces sp. JEL0866]